MAKAAGEAAVAAAPGQAVAGPNPRAEAARLAVVTDLNARSAALFETDRGLKLTPMLKAAGVSIHAVNQKITARLVRKPASRFSKRALNQTAR